MITLIIIFLKLPNFRLVFLNSHQYKHNNINYFKNCLKML